MRRSYYSEIHRLSGSQRGGGGARSPIISIPGALNIFGVVVAEPGAVKFLLWSPVPEMLKFDPLCFCLQTPDEREPDI